MAQFPYWLLLTIFCKWNADYCVYQVKQFQMDGEGERLPLGTGDLLSHADYQSYIKIRRRLGANLRTIEDELKRAHDATLNLTSIGHLQGPLPSGQTVKQWYRNADPKRDDQPSPREKQYDMMLTSLKPRASKVMSTTVMRIQAMTQNVSDYEAALRRVSDRCGEIVARQERAKKQWVDESFVYDWKSIVYGRNNPMLLSRSNFDLSEVRWIRPYEAGPGNSKVEPDWKWLFGHQQAKGVSSNNWVVFRENTNPQDIKQGALGNCWFVAAMSLVVMHKLPLQQIFITPDFLAAGCYALRLCIDGRWQGLLVDDKVPSVRGQLIFSKARHRQLWTSLIEKALAKAYGCYEALVSGHAREGLSTLTGEPVETVELPQNDHDEIEQVWAKLLASAHAKYLIAAGSGRSGDHHQTYKAVGLSMHHVYAILKVHELTDNMKRSQRLVCLRNPWGKSDWQGDWADSSSKWRTCPHSTAIRHDQQEDGTFWMSYSDLLRYFSSVDICKLRPSWHETRFTAPFYRRPGKSVLVTVLSPESNTSIDIMLHQMGMRRKKATDREYLNLTIFVVAIDSPTGSPEDITPTELIGTSNATFENLTFIHAGEFQLTAGHQYAVVAFSLPAAVNNEENLYALSVHSDRPLLAEAVTVASTFLGKTLVTYAKTRGKRMRISDSIGLYSPPPMGGIALLVVAENLSARAQYFKMECKDVKNLNPVFRGNLITADIVPAHTHQVIQILMKQSPKHGWETNRGVVVRPAFDSETFGNYPKNDPPIPESSRALIGSLTSIDGE